MTPDFSSLFAAEPAPSGPSAAAEPWLILLVDDEPDIHAVLRLALQDVVVAGRPLRLLDAASGADARTTIAQHPELALILLDVVMETELAGLDLVRHIREELANRTMQIVVVTGQPGYAPQRRVISDYDINGYLLKSELSADKIFLCIHASLRAHRLLADLELLRRQSDRQRDLLQKSNEDLEHFAYVASHDLRQPLRSISSYLSLIARRLGNRLDEEESRYLGFAVDGAKKLDGMIAGLLEYSRVGRSAEPAMVCLGEVIREVVQNLSVAIKESRAQMTITADFPEIFGVRSELSRLFQNLIGNAIKYRHPERPVEIELGFRAEPDCRLFWVRDNGIGIAADQREQAFGIFQRLAPKSAVEGSGIGLAVCRRIVEHHQGRIWIEDAPGGGCVVMISLPAR